MDFGKKIRKLREKAGLSQAEFAKMLKVAQPNITRWESGAVIPSIKTITKIAKTLNISLDEIVISASEKKKYQSTNTALLKRLKNIEELNAKDQKTLFSLIDAFIKSKK